MRTRKIHSIAADLPATLSTSRSPRSLSRWASQASGIDTTITNVATTFTSGTLLGRLMLAKIHCGSVS